MFNVIRIPTKFSKPISRLSDKDQLRLYKLIRDIGDGKNVAQTDDNVGDILSLIYAEWMNMEIRNGYKRECSHLCSSEGVGEPCPSDSGHRVEYNRVEYNRVEYNKIEENKLKKEKIDELKDKTSEGTALYRFCTFLESLGKNLQEELKEDFADKVYEDIKGYYEKMGNTVFISEMDAFIAWHTDKGTIFKDTRGRLRTWFLKK